MAVLVVVGLMNLVWMVAVALIFLAEKNWRYAARLARAVGIGLLALGVTIIVHPSLLPSVSGVGDEPPVMSEHMGHMG